MATKTDTKNSHLMHAVKQRDKQKLLFVVTEDWYFCSHRLPIAIGAIKAGFDVAIATRVTNHGDVISAAGIEIHPWNINRGSTNIGTEINAFWGLLKICWKIKPDLIHQVAIKPVLYGSLIAKLVGSPKIVNALGGMGFVFNNNTKNKRWLKPLILAGFKWLLPKKNHLLILQTPEDRKLMVAQAGVSATRIRLIRGVGVNVDQFSMVAELDQLPLVVLPARMLWDKGVGEYVEAAQILRKEGVNARFALVGGLDDCNPLGISLDQMNIWIAAGYVEWFGLMKNMPEVFHKANLVCLPSYAEGIPKVLLEAAACGRAIVTTDVPGCREVVKDGENGILVAARDAVALAAALKRLILDPDLRRQMGSTGRKLVIDEFSEDAVVAETVGIYKELLDNQILFK